jgi:hypothetical protein
MDNGSIYTGTKVRTRQSPLYASYALATTTPVPALVKLFGDVDGVAGIGPELTNMQKAFELQGGYSFLVRAMRVVLHAAAADITSFAKGYTVRLIAGGIRLLDAPCDFWAGGAGVATLAANGIQDPRAIAGFDLDPIALTDGINFRVEFVGTSFATTAAFFARVYLDGQQTEPV